MINLEKNVSMNNMENQVLSIEQMRELEELGIDTSKAYFAYDSTEYLTDRITASKGGEIVPAFTLQDILRILPEVIMTEEDNFELYLNTFQCYILYKDPKHNKSLNAEYGASILEAAFNALKWCKRCNYI